MSLKRHGDSGGQRVAQDGPFKIPVTASFNNGELELTKNIIRKGDAMMVEATAYACEEDSDD